MLSTPLLAAVLSLAALQQGEEPPADAKVLAAPPPRDPRPAVRVGVHYPAVGATALEGRDQWRGAKLAMLELNRGDGVLGHRLELVGRNSIARGSDQRTLLGSMIDREDCRAVLGGSSTEIGELAGEVCAERGVPYFGVQVYGDYFTTEAEHPFVFRECPDTWAFAHALGRYLRQTAPRAEYFYVTADTSWGHATESALRRATDTRDLARHRGLLIDFPESTEQQFRRALAFAQVVDPDVLVLALFGQDLVEALQQVESLGLGDELLVVVPQLTLGMAELCGPEAMAGVVGAVPWCWRVPYSQNHPEGRGFVERFVAAYGRYPSSAAASSYTVVKQWAAAAERARSFEGAKVVQSLEDHVFRTVKDDVRWRGFDHQAVQTIYVVRGRPPQQVRADRFGLDAFELVHHVGGQAVFRTRDDWDRVRQEVGLPSGFGPFEGALTGRNEPGRRLRR